MSEPHRFPDGPDPAEVIRRLEALIGRPGVAADYVHSRIDILRAQADALRAISDAPSRAPEPADAHAPPLVGPEMLRFPGDVAAGLLAGLIGAGRRHGRGSETLDRIETAAAGRPDLVIELGLRVAFDSDPKRLASLSEETQAPRELLVFLARLVAAPFAVGAARRLEDLSAAAGHDQGWCPVCGSAPGLASLEPEEGRRALHCSLCGFAWPFARLACPFCGRQEAGLSRLAVEGEDARWIEACPECRRYLKTVDRKRLADDPAGFVPLVEEAAGLYLDLLAERDGLVAGPPYAAPG